MGGEVNAECTPSPIKGWRDSDPNPGAPRSTYRSGVWRDGGVIMERVVTLLRHADTKQGRSLASTNGYRQANIIDILIGAEHWRKATCCTEKNCRLIEDMSLHGWVWATAARPEPDGQG